jgi:hypothetical protein
MGRPDNLGRLLRPRAVVWQLDAGRLRADTHAHGIAIADTDRYVHRGVSYCHADCDTDRDLGAHGNA